MNILVVDDDKLVRMLLKRLLQKRFPCDVVEAENGLDALLIVESRKIDLMLLDISMPIMDGLELLRTLRSSQTVSSMPVIIMSSSDEKNVVIQLIQLGISDYILKPLTDTASVSERISRVMAKLRPEIAEPEQGVKKDKKLLIVEKDAGFRSYFKSLFSDRFDIIEKSSGAEGLKCYLEEKPSVVCLCEGLPVINESRIAAKIRSVEKDRSEIFFLYEETAQAERILREHFNGTIRKSYVPNVFRREFLKTVLNETTPYETLSDTIKNQLTGELLSSSRQTFGLMTMQEIRVIENRDSMELNGMDMVEFEMLDETQNAIVSVALSAKREDIISTAKRAIEEQDGFSGSEEEVFAKIVSTIAGRIQTSLSKRGFAFEKIRRAQAKSDIRDKKWLIWLPFETEAGGKFLAGISLKDRLLNLVSV